MKITNAVKDAAASGQRIRGIHQTFAAPAVIEVLANVELHFVYIDGEHGCFDWRDVEMACLAAERHRLTPIARIPDRSQGAPSPSFSIAASEASLRRTSNPSTTRSR